jgi:hypothetical protein
VRELLDLLAGAVLTTIDRSKRQLALASALGLLPPQERDAAPRGPIPLAARSPDVATATGSADPTLDTPHGAASHVRMTKHSGPPPTPPPGGPVLVRRAAIVLSLGALGCGDDKNDATTVTPAIPTATAPMADPTTGDDTASPTTSGGSTSSAGTGTTAVPPMPNPTDSDPTLPPMPGPETTGETTSTDGSDTGTTAIPPMPGPETGTDTDTDGTTAVPPMPPPMPDPTAP